MATHYEISPDDAALALSVANRALRVANGISTSRPGNVFIPNVDEDGFRDGTGTWIGSGSVGNGGVAEWVGDTTAPGRPTGVSATSAWGVIYAKWDGTLEGGVPADFAYVAVAIDGTEVGRLAESGTVASDGWEDGREVTVSFVAYDAARDRTGALSPNASEPATVTVTVSDERDAIDEAVSSAEQAADEAKQTAQEAWDRAEGVASEVEGAVQEAKDAAQAAQDVADSLEGQLEDITTTVNGVQQTVDELATTVTGAVETADAAMTAATEARQTATEIGTTATQALETAEGALTQATEARQTADSISATLETDYVSKTDAEETYATKTELEATSEGLTATITEVATTADAAMTKATEVEVTASEISATLTSDYLTKDDAEATYATQSSVTQTAEEIRAEVSAAASTAETAMERASAVEQTVDGITASVTAATETAESALEQATSAVQTVEGFQQTVSETYATKTELEDSIEQEVLDRNSAIEQSATEIAQTVSETYQVKGDYLTASEAEATYATQSSVTQTADSILSTVETTYVSQEDAASTYATKSYVDQQDDSITQTVSSVQTTANDAYDRASYHYGTCSTAAATAAKVVTCSSFTRYTGAMVMVHFTYANTAASPTLNVNSTGAAAIRADNSALTASSDYNWAANSNVLFVYSGTYWYIADSSTLAKYSSIKQTADSIQSTVSDLEGDVSTVTQTVDGLEVRLETAEGDIADAQAAADDAAKTATNYLGYSADGLVVGDMTASTLGYNTRLTSSAMEVRNGSTVLASYGADTVSLGANSTSSTIEMCGGVFEISTESQSVDDDSYTVVKMDATASGAGGVSGITLHAKGVGNAESSLTVVPGEVLFNSNNTTVSGRLNLGGSIYHGGVPWFSTLWSGTWTSGSVTVENGSAYHLFLIYLGGVNEPVLAAWNSDQTQVNGIGGGAWSTSSGGSYLSDGADSGMSVTGFRATVSGSTWTLAGYKRQNTNSRYLYSVTGVTRIVGLI